MKTQELPRFRSLIFQSLCVYGLLLVASSALLMFATNKLTEDMLLDRLLQASLSQQSQESASLHSGPLSSMPGKHQDALARLGEGKSELDDANSEIQVFKQGRGKSARYAMLSVPGDGQFTSLLGLVGLGTLVTLGLALTIGYRLTNRFCQPVEDIVNRLQTDSRSQGQPLVAELSFLRDEIDRYRDNQQARLDHEKSFVSSVSHELRTPITIIQGAVELLLQGQRDAIDAIDRGRVDRIARAANSLSLTTRSLLALTRAEHQLWDTNTTFREALGNVVEQARLTVQPGVSVDYEIQAHPQSPFIWTLLIVAVQTLLNNAVRHTQAGLIFVEVARASDSGDR